MCGIILEMFCIILESVVDMLWYWGLFMVCWFEFLKLCLDGWMGGWGMRDGGWWEGVC